MCIRDRDTDNRLIHIGRPIQLDEREFFIQLKQLEDASKDEIADIRPLVAQIVPTYVYGQNAAENEVKQ